MGDRPPIRTVAAQPGDGSAPDDRRRPPGWVALLVVGAALVVLALALGTPAANDPTSAVADQVDTSTATAITNATTGTAPALGRTAPTTTTPPPTTTTTRPPTLLGVIPDLGAEVVRIAYLDPTTDRMVVTEWAGFAAEPAPPNPVDRDLGFGRFSPDGSMYAGWDGSALAFDWWTIDAGVSGWAWHPASTALAWTAQPLGRDDVVLYRADDPFAGRSQVVEVASLPPGSWLIDWGDWGYAVSTSHQQADWLVTTTLLDPEGTPTVTLPGPVLAAGATGRLVVEGHPDAFTEAIATGRITDPMTRDTPAVELPEAVVLRHPGGEVVPIDSPAFAPDRWYLFTPDGAELLVVGANGREWDLEVFGADESRTRSTIAATAAPIGLSSDGRWLISQGPGILQFHDWRRSQTHRVRFRLGQVVDIHL